MLAIAAYINDKPKLLWYLDRSFTRLQGQIDSNGDMPQELKRPLCEHYQLFTLQGFSILARLARNAMGRDLWAADFRREHNMSSMCLAASRAVPFFRVRPVCEGNQEDVSAGRWLPLWYEASSRCPGLRKRPVRNEWMDYADIVPSLKRNPMVMPAVFHPHDAIAPFWNFGLDLLI